MFDKLVKKLGELNREAPRFDPSILGDPVASKTAWGPLVKGGANFRTHSFKQVSRHRAVFRPAWGMFLFGAIFAIIGGGVMVTRILQGDFTLDADFFMPVIIGGVFLTVGLFIIVYFMRPVVFDRQVGAFWKGYKTPMRFADGSDTKVFARLEDIYAVQLLSEFVRGNKSSYHSYEINLVLKDGSRLNVVDHGAHRVAQIDAYKLGEFLDVRVWDSTDQEWLDDLRAKAGTPPHDPAQ